MNTQNNKISAWKNFLMNAGFHCLILGMVGVLAIILIGFLSCCLGFPKIVFYIAIGAGLVLGIIWSVLCMKCNCSNLRSGKE